MTVRSKGSYAIKKYAYDLYLGWRRDELQNLPIFKCELHLRRKMSSSLAPPLPPGLWRFVIYAFFYSSKTKLALGLGNLFPQLCFPFSLLVLDLYHPVLPLHLCLKPSTSTVERACRQCYATLPLLRLWQRLVCVDL